MTSFEAMHRHDNEGHLQRLVYEAGCADPAAIGSSRRIKTRMVAVHSKHSMSIENQQKMLHL